MAIVLECMSSMVSKAVGEAVSVPLLGIGAGAYVDCREERLFLACNGNSSLGCGRAGTREHPLLLAKADFLRIAEMLFLIPRKRILSMRLSGII